MMPKPDSLQSFSYAPTNHAADASGAAAGVVVLITLFLIAVAVC